MPLTLKITGQERAKRLSEVRQALASVRLEGLEPGGEAQSIYRRYVEGELTLEQMGMEIEALHDREHGPIPVSRNGRP
jgi:Antitoxin VbhA